MDLCQFETDRCKGCELCLEYCPKQCLALHEELNAIGYHPAYLAKPDECIGCAMCADMCPETVITVYRRVKVKK